MTKDNKPVYGLNKSNYIFPISVYIRSITSLLNGIQIIGTI